MPKRVLYSIAALVATVIAVVAIQLAEAQSAAGGAFPAYSSHRADAQGVKALFDVVEATGRPAIRSYLPLGESSIKNSTILRLGLSPGSLYGAAAPQKGDLSTLASAGNTVVLGLAGKCQELQVRDWQLATKCIEGQLHFQGAGWTPMYGVAGPLATVVERKLGTGSIMLIGDSNLLRNSGLARYPAGDLLALILERQPSVIFDEHHLGVTDAASTGTLLRRYRLQGLMIAVIVLFGAFVWKNASSFLPREEVTASEVIGKDTGTGLASLLRRTVPAGEILTVAFAEWSKATKDEQGAVEIRRIASAYGNPVDAYNAVTNVLQRKRNID